MKMLGAIALAMLSLVLVLGANQAGEKDKAEKKAEPKYKISEVMKKAHGDGGLLEKVTEGTASAKEKALLLEMYVALHENTPPKGDKSKWAKFTQTLVDAAKVVNEGKDEKAAEALAKVVNCKACHVEFKAPKKQ